MVITSDLVLIITKPKTRVLSAFCVRTDCHFRLVFDELYAYWAYCVFISDYSAVQRQNTITAYFSSNQLLPFDFAEQYKPGKHKTFV